MNTLLDAVSNPTETLVNAINQALREEEYVALVCEVCRLPQKTTDGEPGYKISKPKEIVGKILPLAKVGMQVAFLVNKVSSVGRVFGLPTPVLQDSTMSAASSFLNDLGQESLDSFPSLQQKVQECYENNKNTTDSELSEQDDSTLPPPSSTSIRLGYCVREFGRFLKKMDPDDIWCNLSPKVTADGEVVFACPTCCSESNS
jgi:hypothetical protein